MLCGALVILMLAGLLMIFMPYNKYAVIGYGSAGALIFSMYIVYDTQVSPDPTGCEPNVVAFVVCISSAPF